MNRMGHFVKEVNRNLPARFGGEERGSVSLLYDRDGNRKYLTTVERNAFLRAARKMPAEVNLFSCVLAYSGARISEALALTPHRIDVDARLIILESLKKRQQGVFRAVPLPERLISELNYVYDLGRPRIERIWPWSRTTAWNAVKICMAKAGVSGIRATPKGLRHGFAIGALQAGVPITLVRKWLGHSRLATTEIYADAVGEEEQAIANRFWKTFTAPHDAQI